MALAAGEISDAEQKAFLYGESSGKIKALWRQHLPPFGVLLGRGVKTLAHLKAGNQSVTS
jgi:hypothetical protein